MGINACQSRATKRIYRRPGNAYPLLVETVNVKADCQRLTVALESVLIQGGYRTLRSFDLPLNAETREPGKCSSCAELCPDGCACRYTVLLVLPRPGASNVEAIAVQGKGESSVVTLLPYSPESDFSARFALLLMEALRVSQVQAPGSGAKGGLSHERV